TEKKATRLSKAAREFNVGISTIVEFLKKKGHQVDSNPNSKLDAELYALLVDEYSSDLNVKKDAEKLTLKSFRDKNATEEPVVEPEKDTSPDEPELLITDKTTAKKGESKKNDEVPAPVERQTKKEEEEPAQPVASAKEDTKKEEAKEEKEEQPVEKTPVEKAPVEKEEKPEKEEKKEEEKVEKEEETPEEEVEETEETEETNGPRVVGMIDLDSMNQKTRPKKKSKKEKDSEREDRRKPKEEAKKEAEPEPQPEPQPEVSRAEDKPEETSEEPKEEESKKQWGRKEDMIPTQFEKLKGLSVVGKIDLPERRHPKKKKPVASSTDSDAESRKKRKRIKKDTSRVDLQEKDKGARKDQKAGGKRKKRPARPEVSDEDVQKQIKDTLAKLTTKGSKSKTSKYRREKRDTVHQRLMDEEEQHELDRKVLKVTEFVSVSELASMMDVPPTEVIQTCMSLGLFVSINQRLDAETMALVADEFGFTMEFISADVMDVIAEEVDEEATLIPR
ncbi:MAG: translation initiation factor IF-2 N-terminal domain-containing protein, partial [Bacteroidales bacterium]|nr:translation initiation factor IF-2 N-terminal domain-containing protein [Bacteroidales bacterium]